VIYGDGYTTATSRYTGISVTLYGNGEAAAVSHSGAESRVPEISARPRLHNLPGL
jgi:hypothetical protein